MEDDQRVEGFWGIALEPNKSYTQVTETSIHVTNAALDDVKEDPKSVSQVRVEVEKNEYVLCTLRPGKVDQSNLSVFFSEGERVTFRVTGNRRVHLTGYHAPPEAAPYDDDDMDFDDEDDEDEDDEFGDEDDEDDEDDDEDEDEDDEATANGRKDRGRIRELTDAEAAALVNGKSSKKPSATAQSHGAKKPAITGAKKHDEDEDDEDEDDDSDVMEFDEYGNLLSGDDDDEDDDDEDDEDDEDDDDDDEDDDDEDDEDEEDDDEDDGDEDENELFGGKRKATMAPEPPAKKQAAGQPSNIKSIPITSGDKPAPSAPASKPTAAAKDTKAPAAPAAATKDTKAPAAKDTKAPAPAAAKDTKAPAPAAANAKPAANTPAAKDKDTKPAANTPAAKDTKPAANTPAAKDTKPATTTPAAAAKDAKPATPAAAKDAKPTTTPAAAKDAKPATTPAAAAKEAKPATTPAAAAKDAKPATTPAAASKDAKPATPAAAAKPTPGTPATPGTPGTPKQKTLNNGLTIEDKVVGDGKKAKKGRSVSVRYIGRLDNGKVFDSNTSGKPFSFTLGKGEVIKGWDMGVEGMAVGGERKLIVPAPLAYGEKGAAPDIPKNARLTFEVKLLAAD